MTVIFFYPGACTVCNISHLCSSCITEVGHRNNMTICAKRGGNNHIYTSNGRHVQIYINTRRDAPQEDFTLQYNGMIDHNNYLE